MNNSFNKNYILAIILTLIKYGKRMKRKICILTFNEYSPNKRWNQVSVNSTLLFGLLSIVFCLLGFNSNAQCPFTNSNLNACSGISFFQGINPPSVSYTWSLPQISPSGSLTGAIIGNQNATFQQTLINNTNSVAQAVYTITPINSNCNPGFTYQITVSVFPKPTVSVLPNQTICSGVLTQPLVFTGPIANTTFSQWTNSNPNIGLASSGNGNITGFLANNSFTTNISSIISITPFANGCAGDPTNVTTLIVKPIPNVFSSSNQSICAGDSSTLISLSSSVANTTYQWTNSNSSIGLLAAGTGNVPKFLTINSTNQPITANINAIPTANQCVGLSTFITTFTVRPKPTADLLPNLQVCNGGSVPAIVFTGPVVNTTFSSWTNSNSTIGLQSSGGGNISQFTALNFSNIPSIATISVTPFANGCLGQLTAVKIITVRPSPTVNQLSNIDICGGNQLVIPSFIANVANSIFFWQNNNTSIGLAAQSQGNISSFEALNNGNGINAATISVRSAEPGCTQGNAMNFTVNVKPIPTVDLSITVMEKCSNQSSSVMQISSNVSNASFNWVHSAQQIITLPLTGNSFPLPTFNFVNNTNTVVEDSIIFTATFDGCIGESATLYLSAFPLPQIIGTTEITVCGGQLVTEQVFSSNLPNTFFSWTNIVTEIGLSANGSSPVIPSFECVNTSNDTIIANVTIQATSQNGCVSDTILKIIVLPDLPLPNAAFTFNANQSNVLFTLVESNQNCDITWDFGDGNTATGDSISHTYSENNVYSITVTLTNICGESSFSNQTLSLTVGTLDSIFEKQILIFPNPLIDIMNVRFGELSLNHIFVEIIDLSGKSIIKESFFNNELIKSFDLHYLKSGIYFLKVTNDNKKHIQKIIKI